MNKKEAAKAYASGRINEATFDRLIQKEINKPSKKISTRKKRISPEDRKARSDSLLCILALMHATKWERKEKTDFDWFLSDLTGLADNSEIRKARALLNRLLKKNNMLVQTNAEQSHRSIIVTFVLKPKYRRVLFRHTIGGAVCYLNIDQSHIKKFILSESSDLLGNEFKYQEKTF